MTAWTLKKAQALNDILRTARTGPERAAQFLSIQFEGDVTSELSGYAMYTLTYLCIVEYESLDWCEEALTQTWLQDGLTKEEAAKVVALNSRFDTDAISLNWLGKGMFYSNPVRCPQLARWKCSWSAPLHSSRQTGSYSTRLVWAFRR